VRLIFCLPSREVAMNRVSSSVALALSLAMALALPMRARGQGTSGPANKIAFLRGRAVWVAETNGSRAQKLTDDRAKVEDFLFSPTHRYLAYSAVVGSAEQPGLWDRTEAPPRRSVLSIVVLDLQTNRALKPTDPGWVKIIRWLPGDKLFYLTSDGFAVTGYFVYDIPKNSIQEMPSYDERAMGSDFSLDGSLEAYVDDFGRDLHLVLRETGSDAVLVSGKGNITDVRISNDRKHVAFLQVEAVERTYFDVLWLYDRESASCRSFYRGLSHQKSGGVNYLAWSPDDRYVGMLFSPEAIILDVRQPGQTNNISGANLSWIAKNKLILNRNDDLYVYDLATGSSRLLIRDAARAVFLR